MSENQDRHSMLRSHRGDRNTSAVSNLHEGQLVDEPPQIPPGTYKAIFKHHETSYSFKTPKVYLHFELQGGDYAGMRLYRAFRVKELRGKQGKGGRFKLRHSHELYRQFVKLSGARERPDRISLRRLKHCLLNVSVRTVTTDSRQRPLPPALRYSVIDDLVSVEAGQP